MESVRGLTGAGPSQVGPGGAMRARDVSRPRAEHIAAAEGADAAGDDANSRAASRKRAQRRKERGQPAGDGGSSPVSS